MDLALHNYLARQLIHRTPEFISFCGGTADPDRLGEFLKTPKGKMLAARLDYPRTRKREVFHYYAPQAHRLVIVIDLNAPKRKIKPFLTPRKINSLIDTYHKPFPARPRGKAALDLEKIKEKLLIYDTVTDCGGNFHQAMRRLYPQTADTGPAYDEEADRLYKKILRAYREIASEILPSE